MAQETDFTGAAEAHEVMAHVRALRQELLTGGPEPVGDQQRSGLTGPQVAVMAHLVTRGPSTVTELAADLHLSHSTTSGIVDRLQARELVVRTPDPRDRRRTRIAVTSPVTDYVGQLAEGPFGRLTIALAGATEQQRRAVLDGLALLRGLLADPSGPRPAHPDPGPGPTLR